MPNQRAGKKIISSFFVTLLRKHLFPPSGEAFVGYDFKTLISW